SLKRPVDLLNSLAGAAWIILVWDPQQLFQASFQLSFGVVLSIGLLLPPFEKARQRLLRTDPLLPAELRPAWQRRLDPVVRYVTSSLAISLAAWLGSLPLIAWYFHLFTPVSLLANMVVVPLSAPALMSCLGSLLCASWLPGATILFNHSGWFWMYLMDALSNGFARLPGAYHYMVAPSPVALAVYYALLFSLLNGWLLAPGRRKWAAAGLGLATAACVSNWHLHQPAVRITVLATRSGDALFVDAPGTDRDLLVDCSDAAGAQSLVKPFLRGQGAGRLGALVLTHGDGLNVGGAETILHDFQVRRTVTSSVRFRSSVYRQVLQQLEESPEQWRPVRAGEGVCGWKILHPAPEDRFPLADDNALVLLGEFHGVRVLLLSDLGAAGQRALLARGGDLRADIVVTGMPA
ncbi:MAG: ComEC/Rec2 family competence protein, partial [Pedosphaera parvula]|nr:ComEC/Rec2 family competence protein [Pedosphaera parvula]